MSRYDFRKIAVNEDDLYQSSFEKRGIKYVKQYVTPVLQYPTAEQISTLNLVGHIWKHGDRFYKLAFEYYGKSELWYIIAFYNKLPTENHVSVGDILYIPFPLNKIMKYIGV